MRKRLKDFIVVIPLHLPLGYPSDYIDQTAHILSKNNLVILFDFRAPILWKQILRNFIPILKSYIKLASDIPHGEVYFRPISIFPTRNLAFIHRLNQSLGLLQLKLFLLFKRNKIILWGFDPIMEQVVGKLGENISVYDCIDLLGEDQQTKLAKDSEKKLFNGTNVVIFNSQGLSDQKTKLNSFLKKKSFVTVCGCNVDLFQKNNIKVPADFKSITGKKIILAGVFDYRLDIELLRYVVLHNPKLNFIFIGPLLDDVNKEFFTILKKKNVHYLGNKRKEELPVYYRNSNVGIVPYKTSLNFVKYSNPMKVYEYFAAGIPVVSTEIEVLNNYPRDIICTTDDYAQFSLALSSFLNNWSETTKNKARKIAKINSWDNKIEKIEKFIIENLILKKIQPSNL